MAVDECHVADIWKLIIPQLPLLFEQIIPSDYSIHEEQVPASAWPTTIWNCTPYSRFFHSNFSNDLSILDAMVFLDKDKLDQMRLLKFYKVFDSHAELQPEDADRLLSEICLGWSWKSWNTRELLLALGIVKWPQYLFPNTVVVNRLLSSLEASYPAGVSKVALQAAWYYGTQLEWLTDESLQICLLYAVLINAPSLWEVPDEHNEYHYNSCINQIFKLIQALCRTSGSTLWEYPFQYQKIPLETFMNTIEGMIGMIGKNSSTYLAISLAMPQELREVSHLCSGGESPQKGDSATIISVWCHISSGRKNDLFAENGNLLSNSNDPFDLREYPWWELQIWMDVINWSTNEYVKLDPVWFRELSSNINRLNQH
ncbi:hypothetical protein M422DRAFT_43169 [Sphaerobolus stellatus SS14]|nr:hypothetical protein M422DRAFT_43169 [Sphaerobolus stellatus SS14]